MDQRDTETDLTKFSDDALEELAERMDWCSIKDFRRTHGFFYNNEALERVERKKHPVVLKTNKSTFLLYRDQIFACGNNEDGTLGFGESFYCGKDKHGFRRYTNVSRLTQLPDDTLRMFKKAGGIIDIIIGEYCNFVWCADNQLFSCPTTFNEDGYWIRRSTKFNPFPDDMHNDINAAGGIVMISGSGFGLLIQCKTQIFVCGQNEGGQLGLGHTKVGGCKLQPLPKEAMEAFNAAGGIIKVFLNWRRIIVWCKGAIFVTGFNTCGELGLGHNENVNTFTPLPKETFQAFLEAGGIRNVFVEDGHILVQCKTKLFIKEHNRYTKQFWLGDIHKPNTFNAFSDKTQQDFNAAGGIGEIIVNDYHILVRCRKALFICTRTKKDEQALKHDEKISKFIPIPQKLFDSFKETGGIIAICLGIEHILIQCRHQLFLRGKVPGHDNFPDTFNPIITPAILEKFNQAGGVVGLVFKNNYFLVQCSTGFFVYGSNEYGQLGAGDGKIPEFTFLPYSEIFRPFLTEQQELEAVTEAVSSLHF